jgi:peptidoglycan-N-acetylglucosamine deacetylase
MLLEKQEKSGVGELIMAWGPDKKQGAVLFSFDNMGEAADLENGVWPSDVPVGRHKSVYETLPFLLDTLAEYGLRATFFVEAWNVDHYPDAVRAIADAGHEVGNHGYRHEPWFTLPEDRQVATLRHAHERFASIGMRPRGFRPAGGISSAATEALMTELDYLYISPTRGDFGVRSGLAVLPSSPEYSDVSYYAKAFRQFRDPAATGETNSAMFVDAFGRMLDNLAERGGIRSSTCHVTTPLDSLERRDAFRRLVEMTMADDRLWHPTCVEAAEWVLKQDMPEIPDSGFDHWDPRKFFKDDLLAE